MNLRKILKSDEKGFTLIETLIAVSILAMIFSFGLFLNFDQYRDFNIQIDKNLIIDSLFRARNNAMNNLNAKPHGLKFELGKITLFQGSVFEKLPENVVFDLNNKNSVLEVSGGNTQNFEIIFEPLSGNLNSGDREISVSNGPAVYLILINNEGKIYWKKI